MKQRFISLVVVLVLLVTMTTSITQAVSTIGDSFTTISAGNSCSNAIKIDGSLWAWGSEVGMGTIDNSSVP